MMGYLVLLSLCLGADAYGKVYEQALAQYDAQQYESAAQSFEQLVGEGVATAPLFYNLGLAYHRSGQRGVALANYERALRLDPNLGAAADMRQNLLAELGRNQAQPLPPAWQEALLFWHGGLGYSTVRWLAVLAWIAFWFVLGLQYWKPVRFAASAAAALFLLASLCALSAWVKAHPVRSGVITADNTPAYYGLQDTGAVRFELFEGDRVIVDESREGWVRIASANGDLAWVRKENLVELGPPYEAWQKPENAANKMPPDNEALAAGVKKN